MSKVAKTSALSVHPINLRIYGEPDDGLKENIGQFGLQHAIAVDSQNRILSGARRWTAVKALGWDEIRCEVVDPADEDAASLYILNANAYRQAKTSLQQKAEADEYLRLLRTGGISRENLRDRAGVPIPDLKKATPAKVNTPAYLAAAAAGMSDHTYSDYRYLLDGRAAGEIEDTPGIDHEDAVRLKGLLKTTTERVRRNEQGVQAAAKDIRKAIRQAQRTKKSAEVVRQEKAHELAKEARALAKKYLAIMRTLLDEYPDLLHEFNALEFSGFVFDLRDELMEMASRGLLMLPGGDDA